MYTKREIISSFRKFLQERNVDSTYTNKDLYTTLMTQAPWLIKREVNAGRIYKSTSHFQNLRAREVVEVSSVPQCLSIKTNCKIYRTKEKLPEMWSDDEGPIIKRVTPIDNSFSFTIITPMAWEDIQNDPYEKYSDSKYGFFAEGYFWFPKDNPHKANFEAFFKDDIDLIVDSCTDCDTDKDCIKYLDTGFFVPEDILAEMFAKALQQLVPSKQMQEDNQQDKNPTRKN